MTPDYSIKAYPLPLEGGRLRSAYSAERFGAALMLLVFAPLMLATAMVISVLSRRGPLVRHARVGWRGQSLGMLKFRTMWDAGTARPKFTWVEDVGGAAPPAKSRRDERIRSRFAALCRQYSLDELPQLVHVLRGEMSLVGPRPITREELDTYYGKYTDEVLSLRPGMTGLWQIMGRNHLTYSTRRRLDLILVRNASIPLYLRVLLRSVPCVLHGKGAY